MKKKLCNLNIGDLFLLDGIIYEITEKSSWNTTARCDNPKSKYNYCAPQYLYNTFSNYIVVEI